MKIRTFLFRSLIFCAIISVVYLSYGLFISQYNTNSLPDELRPKTSTEYHDYRGVTNAETSLSIGSQPPREVIREAGLAGLDFLFLTDLNRFKVPLGPIGYYEHMLVYQSGLYSYLDSQLLFYDENHADQIKSLGQSQMLFADLLSLRRQHRDEGMVVLAHPFLHGFSWSGEYPQGLSGIEILNLKRIWQYAWKRSKISFLWSGLIYPFNPKLALLRLYYRPSQELDLYDKLTQMHPTVALAGNNSTATAIRIGPWIWRFPSYRTSFEILSNHVLLKSELAGDLTRDSRKILDAIKAGHTYTCVDLLGDPTGFYAEMVDSLHHHYEMGSQLKFHRGLRIVVSLPTRPRIPFEVVLFKDGTPIVRSSDLKTIVPITAPGVYRVSVRVMPTLPFPDGRRTFTWIYTNAFYVGRP